MPDQKTYNNGYDAALRDAAKTWQNIITNAIASAQARANKEPDTLCKNNQLLGIIMVTQEIDQQLTD